jgi:hypothetical protein
VSDELYLIAFAIACPPSFPILSGNNKKDELNSPQSLILFPCNQRIKKCL